MYWVSVIDLNGIAHQVFRDTMPNVILFIQEFGPEVASIAVLKAKPGELEDVRRFLKTI